MIFVQIFIGFMANFTYLIGDEKSRLAIVVDPAGDLERILKEVEKHSLKVKYIINTHAHFDHIDGNKDLALRTGARIIMHEKSREKKDTSVGDGSIIEVGNLKIKVIHTPGHTPESVCLLLDNKLLTGDTLFVGGCGRSDFLESNPKELYRSLQKLMKLDEDIEVYPGHDYGEKPFSTIGYEKKNNYAFKFRTEEEFVQFMGKG
ncbi:MAG: MBL fold metallo-hydrolase [Candidatus Methylarchaceae archaeon HK02M1]|nr:MBL fold metallo-hydrolase [Candidatus Methylarchaceae archaeon HK01M]MCP8311567.1 MBL fold metallo-hydrolase [Candidatus Methylarchaceae archaeon HK02M1]